MNQVDDQYLIGDRARERADRFMQFYYDNRTSFDSFNARVICAGGYSGMANGEIAPDDPNVREATLMADYLMGHGVPYQVIDTETESTSTIENFTKSLAQGLFTPADFSPLQKLGIVSHPYHLRRAAMIAQKLGINPEVIEKIPTQELDSRSKENLLYFGYRAILFGARKPQKMERREALLKKLPIPAING